MVKLAALFNFSGAVAASGVGARQKASDAERFDADHEFQMLAN
jgi:hypothetical protein